MTNRHYDPKLHEIIREKLQDLCLKGVKKSHLYSELKKEFAAQLEQKIIKSFDIMCYFQLAMGKATNFDEAVKLAAYISQRKAG